MTAKRTVLLFWVVVAILYGYFSYNYIRVDMKDRQMDDSLQHLVQLAGNETRPHKDVRELALTHAEELGLPISGDQITIDGSGHNLTISLDYDMGINFPIIRRSLYRHYVHHVIYRQLN